MQKTYFSAALALFWVVFLWGFWTKGPLALGINAAVFLIGLVWLFAPNLSRSTIIPMALLSLSFAFYENPFFKIFALLAFPFLLAIFVNYDFVGAVSKALGRIVSPILFIGSAIASLFGFLSFKSTARGAMAKRIGIGLLVLIVALVIILPLLSSADSAFADKLGFISDFIREIFSSSFIGRIAVFLIGSIVILSLVLGWGRPREVADTSSEMTLDSLIAGIVLWGILAVYALFLWIQLDRLWVGTLPVVFTETETLVKSGFWQLLFLSVINLGIFFLLYRKTASSVQRLLSVFTVASFLLLVSAAHRMLLYVIYYGFSYEKFYALYAVLFCAILFLWLFSRLFVATRSNILKFVAFQFLWMFALVSIFPVEQFIVRANLSFAASDDSRIKLYEMKMLSPDVLGVIKSGQLDYGFDWDPWIIKQQQRLDDKRWYELTISAISQSGIYSSKKEL